VNIETLDTNGFRSVSWDIGGSSKTFMWKLLWPAAMSFKEAQAIIIVVDSSDRDRIVELREDLERGFRNEGKWFDERFRLRWERDERVQAIKTTAGYDILGDESILDGLPFLVIANKKDLELSVDSFRIV
jgi:GTPase SAR1 family protein